MFREKKIKIDLLDVYVVLIKTDNLSIVKDKYNVDYKGGEIGLCFIDENDKNEYSFVVSIDVSHKKFNTGVIVHEVNHCGNMILKTLGVEPSFTNDEYECLLKEYIFNYFYDFIHGK